MFSLIVLDLSETEGQLFRFAFSLGSHLIRTRISLRCWSWWFLLLWISTLLLLVLSFCLLLVCWLWGWKLQVPQTQWLERKLGTSRGRSDFLGLLFARCSVFTAWLQRRCEAFILAREMLKLGIVLVVGRSDLQDPPPPSPPTVPTLRLQTLRNGWRFLALSGWFGIVGALSLSLEFSRTPWILKCR